MTSFEELVQIVHRLRAECPWDREQTHESLRPALIEEAYEAIEAIDAKDYTELKKELGDLLLHILFHSELGMEAGTFTLEEVIRAEYEKLIYRHPHVFSPTSEGGGGRGVVDSEQVKKNWEQLKRREKGRNSVLDGVPAALPALQRATRIQDKASKVGFDWTDSRSVWKKVREEIEELDAEVDRGPGPEVRDPGNSTDKWSKAAEEEFGDLLFSLVNLARHEGIDAEGALREATHKFERRFRKVEKQVESTGRPFASFTLEELDRIWDQVKIEERSSTT